MSRNPLFTFCAVVRNVNRLALTSGDYHGGQYLRPPVPRDDGRRQSRSRLPAVIVDGCPPGLPLSVDDLLPDLRRRRPGQSKLVTQRKEEDMPEIWSGVFEGVTDGTSIGIVFRNTDQRSHDYGDIKDKYRPGHADFTFDAKYGLRDYRGGGRSSPARPCAGSPPAPSPKNC